MRSPYHYSQFHTSHNLDHALPFALALAIAPFTARTTPPVYLHSRHHHHHHLPIHCRSRPLLSAQPNLLTYPPFPYRLRPAKRAALPLTRPVLRTPTVELHSRLRYQRNLLLSFRIPLSHEFHTRGNRFCVWFCCESFHGILFPCVEFYECELFRRGRGLCG